MRNVGVPKASPSCRTAIITGLTTLAIGIFVASVSSVVVPRQATALPAYAAKEGKACGYCHKNPAGGGERNANGKKYEANGHSFKK
jgi:hypothetical protein